MNSNDIRTAFLDYFEDKDHMVLQSSSLIPHDDTLLFTAAGMVPLKDYFMGLSKPPNSNLTSSQKCVRTVDIDLVGDTDRHLTFFEMLGNFSIDNYFKEDAIKYSYDFITNILEVPKEDLWFTVYKNDKESYDIWKNIIGVSEERIQKGEEDNFWHMNAPGPCGPCSEIFIDRGPKYGKDGGPMVGGEDRFIEIWNLVFMESVQEEPFDIVGNLPTKNIDTGMGLERIAMILQDKDSPYQIDTFTNLYTALKNKIVNSDKKSERIILDHIKSTTFMISDGVVPTNEGRGYILRRIIRRAVRAYQRITDQITSMDFLIEIVIQDYKESYPDLLDNKDKILKIFREEEILFQRTLIKGNSELSSLLKSSKKFNEKNAFYLFETFGFPVELTQEIIKEKGITIDISKFNQLFEEHRKKSTKGRKSTSDNKIHDVEPNNFTGYETLQNTSEIFHIQDIEGNKVIFTKDNPFYYESGGQVSDIGTVEYNESSYEVLNIVQSLSGATGLVVDNDNFTIGDSIKLNVDRRFREGVSKSHTAAHIVHASLRNVLGDTVAQAGSSVEPGKLRFDFSFSTKVSNEDLESIFNMSNEAIFDNLSVATSIKSIQDAKNEGALAFFGDKYGDEVRVVDIGSHSKELCGGTHVNNSSNVGLVVLTNESSIGSNLRRVEMLSGSSAYEFLNNARKSYSSAASILGVQEEKVLDKLNSTLNKFEEMSSLMKSNRKNLVQDMSKKILDMVEDIGSYKVILNNLDFLSTDEARQITTNTIVNTDVDIIILINSLDGKISIVGEASKQNDLDVSRYVQFASTLVSGGASKDTKFSIGGGPKQYDVLKLIKELKLYIEDDLK